MNALALGNLLDTAEGRAELREMRRRARQSTGEPDHTDSAPVQTIQPGEGITLPLAAALAWLLR